MIHVEMIDVQSDVFLLLARLVPVEAILEATGGQEEDQKYTQSTGANRDVEQRNSKMIGAIGFFLVEARRTMAYAVTPQN